MKTLLKEPINPINRMKSFKHTCLALALSVAGSLSGYASVSFQNTGTITGWSNYPQTPAHGNMTTVNSPVYKGSTAIRFYQPHEGTGGASYHCEVVQTPVNPTGSTAYYGFSIYLPSNFIFSPDQDMVFSQWARSDMTAPWTLMFIHNHEIKTGGSGGFSRVWGTINAGVWTRIIVKIVNSSTGGELTVWVNGVQNATSFTGNVTPGGPAIRWSAGQYCTWWKNNLPNGSNPMITYMDHFRVASTYAEADPANWTDSTGGFSGYYKIVDRNSAKVAAVQGASTANGAPVILWSFGSAQNDQWQFVPTDSGYYKLLNRKSGLSMAVQNASTAPGAKVIQWAFGSSQNDQWQPVSLGNGYYRMNNRKSGLVLDVTGSGTANGTAFEQWTYGGGNNQQFQLISTP